MNTRGSLPLTSSIAQDGYAFVHGVEMRELLTGSGALSDWLAFSASWDRLELDQYMADGGRYRRRRHAVYAATLDAAIVLAPHQPHYQSRDYNALNGGVARWFSPVKDEIAAHPTRPSPRAGCRVDQHPRRLRLPGCRQEEHRPGRLHYLP